MNQKEKFLKPLLNGEKRICYSMTEKAAGADATGMQTRAEKKGNDRYVLNGEKWFSSAASVADIALVMAKTDPNATQFGDFYDILGQSLATGVGRPRLTNYGEVDQIIFTAVNSVATGAATPEDALASADAQVLDALKKAGYPAE